MFKRLLVAVALVSLVACGGGNKGAKTAATAAPAASPAASPATSPAAGAMHAKGGAMPMGTAEPVPASLNCGGTEPVWANDRTHVFHLAGDPYYGRTKHGKYMCEKDAAKAGYRPSKG